MRFSYLGGLDAEGRRVFYVIGRDEMADGAARLEPFPRNRNLGFFDTMCRDNSDAFAFKPDWIVRFLGHKFQKMFVPRRRRQQVDIYFRKGPQIIILMKFFDSFPSCEICHLKASSGGDGSPKIDSGRVGPNAHAVCLQNSGFSGSLAPHEIAARSGCRSPAAPCAKPSCAKSSIVAILSSRAFV